MPESGNDEVASSHPNMTERGVPADPPSRSSLASRFVHTRGVGYTALPASGRSLITMVRAIPRAKNGARCRLAVVATHPIQYSAPVFRALAAAGDIDLRVFYPAHQAASSVFDRDFGREVTWDVPLTDGYAYQFVENVSAHPGTERFDGDRYTRAGVTDRDLAARRHSRIFVELPRSPGGDAALQGSRTRSCSAAIPR